MDTANLNNTIMYSNLYFMDSVSKVPEITCHGCDRKDFNDWGELAQHINSSKDIRHKNKGSKLWAKKYIHRNAINKLKNIGKKKEFEPRQALTESQLEAKHEAKYTLSGQTKYVPVRCIKCKKGSRQFMEIEHVNSPDALIIDGCYGILCGDCK